MNLQMAADALATAMAIAEAEGLTLIRSSSAAGFKGVTPNLRKTCGASFTARVNHEGKDAYLGSFDTAAEAALCYARHIGPEACWQQAQAGVSAAGRPRNPTRTKRGFGEGIGVPQPQPQLLLLQEPSPTDNVVDCLIVGGDDEDESTSTGTAASELCTVEAVVEACAGSPSSSNASRRPVEAQPTPAPRWKRIRATRTEQFEVQLNAGDATIVLPVPRGAVGGRVRVSVEFSVE